ncbi:hypothetical protein DYB30_008578, partial [Aphanomyces astaci]
MLAVFDRFFTTNVVPILVKSAMQTVGAEGVQKLLEQHLAHAKKAKAAEEVKAKAKRAEEAKAIAAAATKAADEAARKVTSEGVTGTPSGDGGHPNAMGVGGNERKASGVGTAVKTEAKVKAELVGPERTGLARDEVFERELGFHWYRSRIFTPAGWGGVDLEYERGVTRHLTVVREFDETRKDWGYQVANACVERYLRLFASAQSFELRVMWMLLTMECMQLARVSFHRFEEFKGAMRELHERERLERWTVDVGRIELCNDETLLEYLVAFVWTLVGRWTVDVGRIELCNDETLLEYLVAPNLLDRDEVFERELGFHWDRSRIFTPAGWGGVDLEYERGVTRHLTVVREFDETRKDWGYQVANAAGVERYLRLFASAQSFELRVMWMLLTMECMQLARVSFHRFEEFKGAMRELHER